ncbi:MAG: 4-(cytidine 5'-diphospho)-2-C-methyl-D-erythritol kinase [Thermoguttaceae bacterium]|nr:4-(cytidine 5'-diphospho)-2-C-methyl-D-erythritol kinase [Thermoguttaceae bacterium]
MKIDVLENGSLYRVWAPAKINLFFEVLGKRSDGYHDVETLVAPVSLFDQIDCYFSESDAPEITLECFDESGRPSSDVPADRSNLVAKAYDAFCSELRKYSAYDKLFNIHVKIFKKIPTKAGLGGGSSDASAALLVLDAFSGNFFPKSKLREIAGRLGSDVPLFLEEGASIGRGRGELVEAFQLPELWTTIVKPRVGLSTSEVYRRCSSTFHTPKRSLAETIHSIETYEGDQFPAFVSGLLFNRLEEAAALLWDGVGRWKSVLSSVPETLAVQMTGSGSAFFALYPNETTAKSAAEAICALVEHDVERLYEIDGVFVAKTISAQG